MGYVKRSLHAFISAVLFWCSPLHSMDVSGEKLRKRLLAAWNAVRAKCCCPFHMEINAAECSQLPNKWLWLLVLHSKTSKKKTKNEAALAVAWEQKEGINRARNKALVWLESRNAQLFDACPNKTVSERNHKLSCHNPITQLLDILLLLYAVCHSSRSSWLEAKLHPWCL